jgi:benzylsuccinate CoA-transferase BbsE subunit
VGPFLDNSPHPERSLSFWHYNTSKRGITLNLETADGRHLFWRLAASADVILETFPPGYLPSLGLDYDSLGAQNPGLIMCSLTPFGQTGPWRDYMTADLLHMAAGGQMASCGYDEVDAPGAPPIAPWGWQCLAHRLSLRLHGHHGRPGLSHSHRPRAVYRCLDTRGLRPHHRSRYSQLHLPA